MQKTYQREKVFQMRLNPIEQGALKNLAKNEHLSASEYLRNVIRDTARQNGLWPVRGRGQQHAPTK